MCKSKMIGNSAPEILVQCSLETVIPPGVFVGIIVVCSVEPYDFTRNLHGFHSRLLCSVEPCGSTIGYHRWCVEPQ